MSPDYTYRADVFMVHDGDTVTLNIDLGLRVWLMHQKVRLAGIDAPELGREDKAGEKARDALRDLIAKYGEHVIIQTRKDTREKYGRWLAVIYVGKEGFNANDWMVGAGHATRWVEKVKT